ncbi:MAG: DNA polymerase III subunit epsilon [Rhodoferax ferrireducens]|uniref:DNA polymerase III subunit epsilon n=1 Tax=Rhodoferax ferrireducens TaxID=192843 RepID=A0A1W9KSP4_9BURK|nr:MAG: DNA polymerase III subunit epsilon [Rhodoferax ferrireducens]
MSTSPQRPLVLITGASGNLGQSLARALSGSYQVVGLDRKAQNGTFPILQADFSSPASIDLALHKLRDAFGAHIASVVHLVAYFDFSNADDPRYQSVNIDGTRHLLRALQAFEVEQFVYGSTMLVHAPCRPGERIDETHPIGPRWAYPRSKAAAEAVVQQEHGGIPFVNLRLAGVYDEQSLVPTIAQQFARIYERDVQSYFYSGSTLVGQAMLHRDDMLDAFQRTIDRRHALAPAAAILIGEGDAIGYDALQDRLGALMHGVDDWTTIQMPKSVAAAGLWAQANLEPVIPDLIDKGQAPFVRPFMAEMADDHYALDTRRARDLLGWEPQHSFKDELPALVQALKDDPPGWYRCNGVTPPDWVQAASVAGEHPEDLRQRHQQQFAAEYRDNRWPHFVNIALGSWLFTQPLLIHVQEPLLRWSEMALGALLMVFATAALSQRGTAARWVCAGIGTLVMAIPFLFNTGNAAAYLSDSLVGALIFGFAVALKPEPGPSALAALSGPDIPPGWSYNPSAWTQRLPIIATALIGLFVARYLAGYQLGHIPAVWDPFFAGSPTDPQNGTEEVITSALSKAFPVSDAALGGYTYLLEILTGLVGAKARWRTMPWLVVLFGLMIAPLGITSIAFVIIQPIVIGTWSIVALIGAAAILIQIPYSLDELIATLQFVRRRVQAGRNGFAVFFRGDTDTMLPGASTSSQTADEFNQPPGAVLRNMLAGGVSLPWNLGLAALIGLALLFTRLWPGVEGNLAHAHHVIGSLVLTVVSIAAAEVARPARWLMVPLAAGLVAAPFVYTGDTPAMLVSLGTGAALIVLSVRRGEIQERYGAWDRVIR